jgi:hypothetical protein
MNRANESIIPAIKVALYGRRRGGCLDDDRASARGGVAPRVCDDVVDRVRCYLRRVDQDVAHECAVQKCFVAKIMTLVVGDDGAEVGVGITNVDNGRDVAQRGSGRPGDDRQGWCAYLNPSLRLSWFITIPFLRSID